MADPAPLLPDTSREVNARVNAAIARLQAESEGIVALANTSGKATTARLAHLLKRADADLAARLQRAQQGPGTGSFSAASAVAYRRQVQLVAQQVKVGVEDVMAQARAATWTAGAATVGSALTQLETAYTGIARAPRLREAMQFDPTASRRAASVLRSSRTSMDRYGSAMVAQFEQHMALGFAAGLTQTEMIELLTGHGGPTGTVSMRAKVVGKQVVRLETEQIPEGLFTRYRYWAQRIVRTETANAYNAARLDRLDQMRGDFPTMKKKILAHFDARTAWDSVAVHGQVRDMAGPNAFFQDGAGRVYEHPPARPNDRETVIPWLEEWGEVTSTAPLTPSERQLAQVRLQAGQAPFDPQARRLADIAQEQAQAQTVHTGLQAALDTPQLPPGYTLTDSGNFTDVLNAEGKKSGYFQNVAQSGAPPLYQVSPPAHLLATHPKAAFANRIEAALYAMRVSEAVEASKAAQAAAAAEAAAVAQAAAAAKAAAKAAAAAAAAQAAAEAQAVAQAAAAAAAAKAEADALAAARRAPAPFSVPGVAQRLVDKEHRAWLDYIDRPRNKDGGLAHTSAARTAWLKAHRAAYVDAEGNFHAGRPRRTVSYELEVTGRRGQASGRAMSVPWGEAPPSSAWRLSRSLGDPDDPHERGYAGRPLRAFGSTIRAHYADPGASIPGAAPPPVPVSTGSGIHYNGSSYARSVGMRPVDFDEDPLSLLNHPLARTQTGVAIPADADQFEGLEIRARIMTDENGREFFQFHAVLRDEVGDALARRLETARAAGRPADYRWWPTNVRTNAGGQLRLARPGAPGFHDRDRVGGNAQRREVRVARGTGPEVRIQHSRDSAIGPTEDTRALATHREEISSIHNRVDVRVYTSDPRAALEEFGRHASTTLGLSDPLARPSRDAVQAQVRAQILSRYSPDTSKAINRVRDRSPATVNRVWNEMTSTGGATRARVLADLERTTSYVHTAGGGLGMYSDALAEQIRQQGVTHLEHMIGAFVPVPAQGMIDIFRSMANDPGGAALLATNERWDRGMLYAGGASSDKDVRTGGAGGVFTRYRTEHSVGALGDGRARIRIASGEFGRLDSWAHNGDEYGEVGNRERRLFASGVGGTYLSGSNELISRGSISLRAVESITLQRSRRTEVVAGLRQLGITQIRGVALETFFKAK